MGCAPSAISPVEPLKVLENGKLINGKSNKNLINFSSPERQIIEKANSIASIQTSKESKQSERDYARNRTPPPEEGDFELPEGNFIDGKLGVTDEEKLKEILGHLQPGTLFVDHDFPANDTSLFFMGKTESTIQWKRPHELVANPQLFVKGINQRDVVQGILGNCWFLSSCSAVARVPKLMEKVIPTNQELIGSNYKGIIICRFWRFGQWVTVCIDDLLPTKAGFLCYARSEDENEFWIALLEKAYAKIHGSYQALEGGQSMDAMVDLTGGLPERFDLDGTSDPKTLYRYISKASKHGAFITASIHGDWKTATKANEQGLVEGHAYTISGVAAVSHKKYGKVSLIRIRNPWANEAEWNGPWSDGDEMWDQVGTSQKLRLLKDERNDGEFWMNFDDFYKKFEEVSMCRLGPDYDEDGVTDKAEQVTAIKGSWIKGKNAGGCRNNFKDFSMNPQFLLTLFGSENDEEFNSFDYLEEETIPVLIGLMQEHRQSKRNESVKMLQIGFCVYKNHNSNRRTSLSEFLHSRDVVSSGPYINYREVICRMDLKPGNYVVIPATFQRGQEGSFMIRIYCGQNFSIRELNF